MYRLEHATLRNPKKLLHEKTSQCNTENTFAFSIEIIALIDTGSLIKSISHCPIHYTDSERQIISHAIHFTVHMCFY